jgi:hypothetical protein
LLSASSSHRSHVLSLEKELTSLRSAGTAVAKSALSAATSDSSAVAELKKKISEQEEQLKRMQAAQAAVALQAAGAVAPEPGTGGPPTAEKTIQKTSQTVQDATALRQAPASPPVAAPAVAQAPTAQTDSNAQPTPAPPAEGLASTTTATGKKGSVDKDRRDEVKKAFMHSWEGYKKFAWGTDELMPQARSNPNP